MSRPSNASTTYDNIRSFINKVDKIGSSLIMYLRCVWPSQHPWHLIYPSLFWFRNIIYARVFLLPSQLRVFSFHGPSTYLPYICFVYLGTTLEAASPKSFIKPFILYCVRVASAMGQYHRRAQFTSKCPSLGEYRFGLTFLFKLLICILSYHIWHLSNSQVLLTCSIL